MRTKRLRDRLALLLAAALGVAGLAAVPAANAADTDDAAEIHGLKGEYYTQSAPAPSTSTSSRPPDSTRRSTSTASNRDSPSPPGSRTT